MTTPRAKGVVGVPDLRNRNRPPASETLIMRYARHPYQRAAHLSEDAKCRKLTLRHPLPIHFEETIELMKATVPRHYAPRRKNGARCLSLNAAPPEPRSTPPLKAKAAESERTGAAPKAASAASGALKIAAPRAPPTQETATQQTSAPQSASDSTGSGQAATPARPALPAAAGETDGLRAQFPIPTAEALARNIG